MTMAVCLNSPDLVGFTLASIPVCDRALKYSCWSSNIFLKLFVGWFKCNTAQVFATAYYFIFQTFSCSVSAACELLIW